MKSLNRKFDIAANFIVCIVGITLIALMAQRFISGNQVQPSPPRTPEPQTGQQVQLSGIDLAENDTNIILVLNSSCRYCAESSEFYARLKREADASGHRVIAAFPAPVAESMKYLADHRLSDIAAVEASPSQLFSVATPTLILVDGSGIIKKSWVGKLSPDKEAEVFSSLVR